VPGFRAILSVKFTGQPEEHLCIDAIVLFGWCALLREVAPAQVQIMDQSGIGLARAEETNPAHSPPR
jgi:hypothetical protein